MGDWLGSERHGIAAATADTKRVRSPGLTAFPRVAWRQHQAILGDPPAGLAARPGQNLGVVGRHKAVLRNRSSD